MGTWGGPQMVEPCSGSSVEEKMAHVNPPPNPGHQGGARCPGAAWDAVGWRWPAPEECPHTVGPWEGQPLLVPLPVSTCQSWEAPARESHWGAPFALHLDHETL